MTAFERKVPGDFSIGEKKKNNFPAQVTQKKVPVCLAFLLLFFTVVWFLLPITTAQLLSFLSICFIHTWEISKWAMMAR